jgi:predicted P-loop ATPase
MTQDFPRPITDEDITGIQEWLQLAGLYTVSRETVAQAIDLVGRENIFHPIKDHLELLKWDGTERLNDWLSDYLGVEKTEYTMADGRMFLIGMIARIYQPGCQADYMLILEGPQGLKKSSACRILAGEWFSDSLPENVASKDAALHLRGKWLVEIAELHTFTKSEIQALKAFLTRRADIYRPPYGRKEVHRPRQNLFIGTTNKKVYLQDPTGGRRFWPIGTTEIDLESLASVRDQLFAEALVRYRRDEPWWPDGEFEAKHIVEQQEKRFEGDAWEEPIAEYLNRKLNPSLKCPNGRTTVFEIAKNCLSFDVEKIGTADQRRITAILERLGWSRGERGTRGIRWWSPRPI